LWLKIGRAEPWVEAMVGRVMGAGMGLWWWVLGAMEWGVASEIET
jgi:hypothetical protein